MALFPIAALLLVASVIATEPEVANLQGGYQAACSRLKQKYPSYTFYPETAGYTYETQTQYWSATTFKGPACVFVPQDAQQVSFAISTLTRTSTKFAVRGGGHMPIAGYNGIDEQGILLSTSNLTQLALSDDQAVVSIGAGNRWREVYSYLAPFGLAAVGGRVSEVGVSGFTLGGGISFYSNQYGFGSDNVVKFQCVLASGKVVDVTATNRYSDLFWALKGGANSFCIVTRFDMKPVKSPKVYVGMAQFDQSRATEYLDAVYNFGKYGSRDPKAAMIPTIVTIPGANMSIYAAVRFYDSATDNAGVWENFTAPRLTPQQDSYEYQTLTDYMVSTEALQPYGLRQEFRVLASLVSRDAVQLIHDTFMQNVKDRLSTVANLQTSLTFQPVTKEFLQQSIKNGGNPQGIDISKAPYFWIAHNWAWTNATDDAAVYAAADEVTASIMEQLEAKSLKADYLYLNDAGKGQPVFQSYPAANLAKLKTIRAKYDPLKVYTNLMPGGWKVANV